MLKTLKKNSRKLIRLKLKIKEFIKQQLLAHILVLSSIALCAWVFNRWIEAVQFCVAHLFIRNAFDKQFHFHKTYYCLILTSAIIWFAIPITLPITASLLSSIPIAFLICYFGCLAQDRIDLILANRSLNKYVNELLAKLNHKDIYSMTDDELYAHCRSRGLSEEECRIAHFVVIDRMKGKELYNAISYSERQTKRLRNAILNKIK